MNTREYRDGEAWWAAVYGVAQSWTRLKWLSSSSSSSSRAKTGPVGVEKRKKQDIVGTEKKRDKRFLFCLSGNEEEWTFSNSQLFFLVLSCCFLSLICRLEAFPLLVFALVLQLIEKIKRGNHTYLGTRMYKLKMETRAFLLDLLCPISLELRLSDLKLLLEIWWKKKSYIW